MVGGPPTAGIAVAFYVVGKADSDRLVGVSAVPQARSIVGADGGWVSTRRSRRGFGGPASEEYHGS
jgi:hypothetical protein